MTAKAKPKERRKLILRRHIFRLIWEHTPPPVKFTNPVTGADEWFSQGRRQLKDFSDQLDNISYEDGPNKEVVLSFYGTQHRLDNHPMKPREKGILYVFESGLRAKSCLEILDLRVRKVEQAEDYPGGSLRLRVELRQLHKPQYLRIVEDDQ